MNNTDINKNTGSAEYQIIRFTLKIKCLNAHLLKNKKDYITQRSLVNMVNKRRRMLLYCKEKLTKEAYEALCEKIKN